jgi:hypothetical protein
MAQVAHEHLLVKPLDAKQSKLAKLSQLKKKERIHLLVVREQRFYLQRAEMKDERDWRQAGRISMA